MTTSPASRSTTTSASSSSTSRVRSPTYGELAAARGRRDAGRGDRAGTATPPLVETVGYGIQSVQPHPQDIESRYKSTSRIVEVNGNKSDGGNLHTLEQPERGRRPGRFVLRRLRRAGVRQQHEPGRSRSCRSGRAPPATAPTTRGGSTPEQLRLPRAIPVGRRAAQSASRTPAPWRATGRRCWCDLARSSCGRTSWSM